MPMTRNGFSELLAFDVDVETMWAARDLKYAERHDKIWLARCDAAADAA